VIHTNNPIIKHKAALLNLAEGLSNVSKASKIMDLSRDTFYRYPELEEIDCIDNLIDKSHRKTNIKNRVDDTTEQAVLPHTYGQHRTSNKLRNNLVNFKRRLKALENKLAIKDFSFDYVQVTTLEKKKHDDEAGDEIETMHPSYLGLKTRTTDVI
jgi:hypothetical protein